MTSAYRIRGVLLGVLIVAGLPAHAMAGMFYFDPQSAQYPASGAATQVNTTSGNTPQTSIAFSGSTSQTAFFRFWWPADLSPGLCSGGSNNGNPCWAGGDCPGGTCNPRTAPFRVHNIVYSPVSSMSGQFVCWRVSLAAQMVDGAGLVYDNLNYGTAAADSIGTTVNAKQLVSPAIHGLYNTNIGPGTSPMSGTGAANRPLFLRIERVKTSGVCSSGNDNFTGDVYLHSIAITY